MLNSFVFPTERAGGTGNDAPVQFERSRSPPLSPLASTREFNTADLPSLSDAPT